VSRCFIGQDLKVASLFGSVVAIAFQSVLHSEMHQNNIFYFLKLFLTSAHQNNFKIQKNINLKQIKKLNFFKSVFETQNKLITDVGGCNWLSSLT
jgi:hypothetical protein